MTKIRSINTSKGIEIFFFIVIVVHFHRQSGLGITSYTSSKNFQYILSSLCILYLYVCIHIIYCCCWFMFMSHCFKTFSSSSLSSSSSSSSSSCQVLEYVAHQSFMSSLQWSLNFTSSYACLLYFFYCVA
jgi:hypothetical protein